MFAEIGKRYELIEVHLFDINPNEEKALPSTTGHGAALHGKPYGHRSSLDRLRAVQDCCDPFAEDLIQGREVVIRI